MAEPALLPALDVPPVLADDAEGKQKLVVFNPQLQQFCLTERGNLVVTVLRQLLQARHLSSALSALGQNPHHVGVQLHPILKATSVNGAAEAGKLTFTLLTGIWRSLIADAWGAVEQVAEAMERMGVALQPGPGAGSEPGGDELSLEAVVIRDTCEALLEPLRKLAALQDMPVTILGKLPIVVAEQVSPEDINRLLQAMQRVYTGVQESLVEIGHSLEKLRMGDTSADGGFMTSWLQALYGYFRLSRGAASLRSTQHGSPPPPQSASDLLEAHSEALAAQLHSLTLLNGAAAGDGCVAELRRLSLCLCGGSRWAAGCPVEHRGSEPHVDTRARGDAPKQLVPLARAPAHVVIGAPVAVEWVQPPEKYLTQVETLEAAVSGRCMQAEAAALANSGYVALLQHLQRLSAVHCDPHLSHPCGCFRWRLLCSAAPRHDHDHQHDHQQQQPQQPSAYTNKGTDTTTTTSSSTPNGSSSNNTNDCKGNGNDCKGNNNESNGNSSSSSSSNEHGSSSNGSSPAATPPGPPPPGAPYASSPGASSPGASSPGAPDAPSPSSKPKWAVAVINVRAPTRVAEAVHPVTEMPKNTWAAPRPQILEVSWGSAMGAFYEKSKKDKLPVPAPDASGPHISETALCLLDALAVLQSEAAGSRRRRSSLHCDDDNNNNNGDDEEEPGAGSGCPKAGAPERESLLRMGATTTQAAVNWIYHKPKLFPSGATMQGSLRLCVIHSDSLRISDAASNFMKSLTKRSGGSSAASCSSSETRLPGDACVAVGELQLLDTLRGHLAALRLETARLQDFLAEAFREGAHSIVTLSTSTTWKARGDGPSDEANNVAKKLIAPLKQALGALDRRTAAALFPSAVCAVLHELVDQAREALEKSRFSAGAVGRQLRHDLNLFQGIVEEVTQRTNEAQSEGIQLEPQDILVAKPVFKRVRLISELLTAPAADFKEHAVRRSWIQLPDGGKWKALRRGR